MSSSPRASLEGTPNLNFDEQPRLEGAEGKTNVRKLLQKAYKLQQGFPVVRVLPPQAAGIICVLIIVNAAVWIIVGIVLHSHRNFSGTTVLAWTLGLRHALDADHISAIDLMTRRLVASNQRPVTVGTFFSLGHSTVVLITCIVVAATASTISEKFGAFSQVGGIIGSSVSAAFLIILGTGNAYLLFLLVRKLRGLLGRRLAAEELNNFKLGGGGCLFHVLKKMFKLIDRPWKMYPLGLMFGLGFDTSSQVALLGISSIQSASGTSIWLILLLPLLFTAGMCLLDTADGALMLALYTAAMDSSRPMGDQCRGTSSFDRCRQASGPSDPSHERVGSNVIKASRPQEQTQSARLAPSSILPLLYTNIILTALTVLIALVIGTLQILNLAENVLGSPRGKFWDGVQAVGDRYDIVGGVICGVFAIAGILSFWAYPRWRRWAASRSCICTDECGDHLEGVPGQRSVDEVTHRVRGDEEA